MTDAQVQGIIFNMQKFSVHDGDGIRTLVFLKGCPLSCRWCSNPESQDARPEHAFNPSRCLTLDICGRCIQACSSGALQAVNGLIAFNPQKCTRCFACVNACPSGAQTCYGETVSVGQVLDKVEEDGVFYHRSGGGMTMSGGEALTQHIFAVALLREAKRRHINTAIETCGFYPYEHLQTACKYLDSLIFDIKCFNAEKHKKHTGVDNARILENFQRVCAEFPALPIIVRTPVIPGFNDAEEEITAIRKLVPKRSNISYELLGYHRMGQPKYEYLGKPYELIDAKLDETMMQKLNNIARQ